MLEANRPRKAPDSMLGAMRIGAFAFAKHIKLFLSLAQNRGFCANERRQRSAVAGRVLRGLLKAEFADAVGDDEKIKFLQKCMQKQLTNGRRVCIITA